ncbi:MAG: SPASM domain-containing protein, partial [Chloroflexi bacterium]|nr:SPASM domain-containing protein [Chloroflexota bacterium]
CPAATSYVRIDQKGRVTPCPYMPGSVGEIGPRSFAEIWETAPLLAALRDRSLLGGRCGLCSYRETCGGCRARAAAVLGDPLAQDPACAWEDAATAETAVPAVPEAIDAAVSAMSAASRSVPNCACWSVSLYSCAARAAISLSSEEKPSEECDPSIAVVSVSVSEGFWPMNFTATTRIGRSLLNGLILVSRSPPAELKFATWRLRSLSRMIHSPRPLNRWALLAALSSPKGPAHGGSGSSPAAMWPCRKSR